MSTTRVGFADALWLGIALALALGSWLFRFLAIEPVWTVAACEAAAPPAFCLPRHAVLWLQYQQVFGWSALLLGVAAGISGGRALAALAVGIGVAATVDYNGTMGIVGAALGITAWLGRLTGRYRSA